MIGISKVYFDKAKKMFPHERNKKRLIELAEAIKIVTNSVYGSNSQLTFINQNHNQL